MAMETTIYFMTKPWFAQPQIKQINNTNLKSIRKKIRFNQIKTTLCSNVKCKCGNKSRKL